MGWTAASPARSSPGTWRVPKPNSRPPATEPQPTLSPLPFPVPPGDPPRGPPQRGLSREGSHGLGDVQVGSRRGPGLGRRWCLRRLCLTLTALFVPALASLALPYFKSQARTSSFHAPTLSTGLPQEYNTPCQVKCRHIASTEVGVTIQPRSLRLCRPSHSAGPPYNRDDRVDCDSRGLHAILCAPPRPSNPGHRSQGIRRTSDSKLTNIPACNTLRLPCV